MDELKEKMEKLLKALADGNFICDINFPNFRDVAVKVIIVDLSTYMVKVEMLEKLLHTVRVPSQSFCGYDAYDYDNMEDKQVPYTEDWFNITLLKNFRKSQAKPDQSDINNNKNNTMLVDKIREDLKLQMKNGNTERKEFLKVIIGELNRGDDKNPNDEKVIKLLKSMRQSSEMLNNDFELSVIDEYLPSNLTEDEVKKIVDNIVEENNIDSMKKIGMLMGKIKQHEKSQFIDMKFVSSYFKDKFKD